MTSAHPERTTSALKHGQTKCQYERAVSRKANTSLAEPPFHQEQQADRLTLDANLFAQMMTKDGDSR
jgi:hypothetical protein